jgi:hypothetical protein
MNEKRMKTSVNAEEVSSPSAQAAGWGVKILVKHGYGSVKAGLGVEKCLVNPCDGRIIAKMVGATQLDTMNIKSNGKSRIISLRAMI